MNRVTARCALLLILTVPAFAQASSFAGSSAGSASVGSAGSSAGSASVGSAGSSASSDSSSGNDKLVLQARDDAAGFVASAGRLRGAQLEAALRVLRERNPQAQQASDLQLAQAILAL
ncbi:DUF2388 domain-containing protein [Xanthomonas translucens]|uniref:DUF2388 domain-containing protein n=1 Tax=Xanthomonas campestris pv. translucens TaxID=343 RepID=UPI0002A7B502|nr:DUF2388 domain-containing protein [Xanthomonas translucens]ELQ00661.1 hypothetical protein A989_16788 [Xanthomonas translucens DAR61454]MBC3973547.1 DUF2388 domain-containing protein [Xanthomonas translucens pv. undulosa]QSQ54917.1 DUF2388 domain-containing protein [Xanthomonas translucens pv. undulosa]UKE38503.1 DUF2388 domain-containing protein [Xanthomonas translucens pv. undulosa]UPU48117.1 DUF2388 domain-containing protein [Xanthomonas translucens pv. undulosa]